MLTANANLRKSKLRTFLTITAVVIGSFTLTMTNGVGDGIKSYVNLQLGNVGAKDSLFVTAKDQSAAEKEANNGLVEYNPNRQRVEQQAAGPPAMVSMNNDDFSKIAAIPGVKSVVKTYSVNPAYVTAGHKKFQTLVTQYIDGFNIDLEAGHLPNNKSIDQVTIPQTYLGPLGLGNNAQAAIGHKLSFGFMGSDGRVSEVKATIAGVQQNSLIGGSSINASSAWVKNVYQMQASSSTPTYIYLIARFDDNMSQKDLDMLKARFSSAGYEAKTIQDEIGTVNQVLGVVTMALNLFGAIALLAASFGIINTLFMAVQERTREIGLMKALGMGRSKIFLLFSLEAILIGLWGSVIGIGLANLAGRLINNFAAKSFLKDFHGFSLLAFPLRSMLLVVVIIVVIAFLAGSLPARRASQKDPIEALRYE